LTTAIITTDDEPEFNRCTCGDSIIICNGKPVHLSEWLARRPVDDD
jgi:hypothetical protein